MDDSIGLFINLGIVLFLLGLGWFVGHFRERRHLANLAKREARMSNMLVTQLKTFPGAIDGRSAPRMFIGEAVIATDYFKSFLARLRNIFGGEVRSYQTLLTRARRESLVRIVEQARQHGYNAVCNVRFENADVGGNSTLRKTAMVCIIASATAYHAQLPSA